ARTGRPRTAAGPAGRTLRPALRTRASRVHFFLNFFDPRPLYRGLRNPAAAARPAHQDRA
ncbi:hypothetical protein, partial [Burkholderia sp. GbtcB21]|uniref:hypothetical protein n=1 Tax=Burkholderia sp. GbtcB21 TaxID=2824766 RepID=UPI001C300097